MPIIQVTVDGIDGLIASLETFFDGYSDTAANALRIEGEKVIRDSRPKVPVDTGLLRASGTVKEPIVNDGQIDVDMGYYTDYAQYVEAGQPHTLSGDEAEHAVGQSHFMRETFNTADPFILENVAKRIDTLIIGGM